MYIHTFLHAHAHTHYTHSYMHIHTIHILHAHTHYTHSCMRIHTIHILKCTYTLYTHSYMRIHTIHILTCTYTRPTYQEAIARIESWGRRLANSESGQVWASGVALELALSRQAADILMLDKTCLIGPGSKVCICMCV